MHGIAEASAAISAVNALPTGVGAAIAISLGVRATASVAPAGTGPGRIDAPDPPGRPLIAATVRRVLDTAPTGPWRVEIAIDSSIPVGRGLKSSSAVAGAAACATASALGLCRSREEIASLTATVAREIGQSATGALDDAAACLIGGGIVADNRAGRLLRHFEVPADLGVVLWIPPGTHPPSPSLRDRFDGGSAPARAAVEAARVGDWAQAIRHNTAAVEEAMGYAYARLHREAAELGAVASGVSGVGPTVAIVAPRERLAPIADRLRAHGPEGTTVRIAKFLRRRSGEAGGT
ncbi:MAG: shikimate kinase [Thermoplasmata archaeon]